MWLSPVRPPNDSAPTSAAGIEIAAACPVDEQILFIKSWNEWAEGNYLEPDAEYGVAKLEALRHELDQAKRSSRYPESEG